MLYSLGRAVYRFRWLAVAAWVCIFGAAAVFAPRVSGVLRGGGYTINNSDSIRAYNTLNHAYGYRALTFTAVFDAHAGGYTRTLAAARRFRADATGAYGRTLTIQPPIASPDRAIIFERIYSQPQQDFGASFAAGLRTMLAGIGTPAHLSGSAAIFHDMEIVSDQDLRSIEVVTLPIALAVLLLIFGSVVASALPILMAPVAVTLALAIIYFIGHRVDMSIFVLNTTSMLGLGVAIDYSLFMVNRFREELRLGRDVQTAVGNTVATSGRAILVSALVVSVGFYALTLSGISMLSSLGIGGSIVTALSLLVAITLLPALLGILGPNINRLPVIPAGMSVRQAWRSIALWVMRYPWQIIGAVAAVILVLAIPAFHLRPGIPGAEILPPSVDSRAGNDALTAHLGVANSPPVLIVVQRHPGTPVSTYAGAAFSVVDAVCSSPLVAGLSSVPVPNSPAQIRSCDATLATLQNASPAQRARALSTARQRSVALVSAFLRVDASSSAAENYVTSLRKSLHVRGYTVQIGGQTAGQMDFNNFLYSRFPYIILFVVGTIYILLLLAFRSVLLPLKAVLMNAFSVLAAYGSVTWAFQDGHLASILGFTVVGNVDSIVPILLFCVLFGVSTDYEVFLLTRVQEEYLLTGHNEESVAAGLEVTGRIITSAATVMIIVFGAFAFARLVVIKEVGLGLAIAVLVDATLIRALLVPATMRLLGRWNWWLPVRGFPRTGGGPVSARGGATAAE